MHSTFRLSREAYDDINQLADVLGCKNAEVFDKLVIICESKTIKIPESATKILAKTDKESRSERKTYVVKKNTLLKLSRLANDKKTTRNLLIEWAAHVFRGIFEEVISAKKKRYRSILEKTIRPFCHKSHNIRGDIENELGFDDPVAVRFGYMVFAADDLCSAIEAWLEDGTPIDINVI